MKVGELLQPRDAGSAAAALKWASAERVSIEIRGGGTKAAWGAPPARVDATLSTCGLSDGIEHVPGDLTATVPAGATLETVNTMLARHDQWLPLDPPHGGRATIGGIVAANDSGPRRHRFGTPRDLVIGVELALADGRIVKAGGRVVKNVAGYDLSRLVCGSFGSLALVTRATFKLAPRPGASRTVVTAAADAGRIATLAMEIDAAALTPSAVEIETAPPRLLIRFETTAGSAERQAHAAAEICRRRSIGATIAEAGEDVPVWREHDARIWNVEGADTVIKIAVLPSELGDALAAIERVVSACGLRAIVHGRTALAVLYARVSGETAAQASAIRDLRRELSVRRGSVVIASGSAALNSLVDPWGDIGDALPIMRAVKARFDPGGILNPGRGPGGV